VSSVVWTERAPSRTDGISIFGRPTLVTLVDLYGTAADLPECLGNLLFVTTGTLTSRFLTIL